MSPSVLPAGLSDEVIKAEAQARAKSGGPLIQNHDPCLRRLIEREYALGFEAGARWARQRLEPPPVQAAFREAAQIGAARALAGAGEADPFESKELAAFLESCVPLCHCSPSLCPCDGVLAGGVCDNIQIERSPLDDDDDYDGYDSDDEDDPRAPLGSRHFSV